MRPVMTKEDTAAFRAIVDSIDMAGVFFIVEGMKDERAVRALGARHVLTLHRTPLFAVAESVPDGSCAVVLTDLDSEGRMLYGRICGLLERRGIARDDRLRNFLFARTDLRQIEGLPRLLDRMDYGR